MKQKIALFSFFSGIGLLDLGFEDSGFEVVYVNEIRSTFLDGYKYSRKVIGKQEPEFGHHLTSINTLLTKNNLSKISQLILDKQNEGYIVGFIGGPPCPDFSVGGKNRGGSGENGVLSRSYVDLICRTKPDFFIFENVKGLIRTKKHRVFFDDLKKDLKKNGFITTDELMNSLEFGVPQDRDRIFLVGINEKSFSSSKVKEFKNINLRKYAIYPEREGFVKYKWVGKNESGKEVPPKELTISHWFQLNDVDNHPNAKHCFQPRAGLQKFKTIVEGDDSRKSYKRLHRNRYSPTAAYGNNEVHIHPTLPRRINVAEVMAIQSLPKDFCLPNEMSLTDMFKTLGNAVPYLLSRGIAKTLFEFLSEK